MGRIRTKDIKMTARKLVQNYPDKFGDFKQNKAVVNELKLTEHKKMRNRIAGYIVRVIRNQKRKNV